MSSPSADAAAQENQDSLPMYPVGPIGFKEDLGAYNNNGANLNDNNSASSTAPPVYHPPPPLPERQSSQCSAKQQAFRDTKRRCSRACRTKPHLFLIFVISVAGFCYHFNLTLRQYWSYKTTSNTVNEEPADYKFPYPASTLCFQDVVPYYQITDRFPDYVENVERIRAEMIRRNDSNFWNDDQSASLVKLRPPEKPVAGNYLHKYYETLVYRNQSILSILEQYSHSGHEECLLDVTPATKYGYKLPKCENVTKVVETINGEYRCFTYFLKFDLKNSSDPESKLDDSNFYAPIFRTSKTFEKRDNKVYYINQAYREEKRPHPFEKDMRARFAIHPSNMVPVPEFYPTVPLYSFSRFYAIDFQKTIHYLLEKPYQTQCFKYDLGNSEAFQSKDDCVTKCVMEEYRARCKCLPMSGFLYRKSLLTPEDFFCSNRNKCQYRNYRQNCTLKCNEDCTVEQYEFDKFVDIPFYAHGNLTGIQIMRRPKMDTVIRHSPDKTAIDLICDFGGLGGLWLGFSVISITTSIIQLMAKPLEKIVVGQSGGPDSDDEEEEVIEYEKEKEREKEEKKSKKSVSD